MDEQENTVSYLESLADGELPEKLRALEASSLCDVRELVDTILERERAGLDSLFSSMTHTMKFIPNLLLQTLTLRYIEPPIAARITEKLSLKQAVAVANGLKPDYVAATNCYLDGNQAADLLTGMNRKKAALAIAYAIEHYPAKALGVMSCLQPEVLRKLVSARQLTQIDDPRLATRVEELRRRF